jgi:hypothetical protein
LAYASSSSWGYHTICPKSYAKVRRNGALFDAHRVDDNGWVIFKRREQCPISSTLVVTDRFNAWTQEPPKPLACVFGPPSVVIMDYSVRLHIILRMCRLHPGAAEGENRVG